MNSLLTNKESQTQTFSIIVGDRSKVTFITPTFITVTLTNSTDFSLSWGLYVSVVRKSLVTYQAIILKPLTRIDTFLLFVSVHRVSILWVQRSSVSFLCITKGTGSLLCRYVWWDLRWVSVGNLSLRSGTTQLWLCSFPCWYTCTWRASSCKLLGFWNCLHCSAKCCSMVNLFLITSHHIFI